MTVVVGLDPDIHGAVSILDFKNLTAEAYHLPTEGVYFKSRNKHLNRLADGPLAEMFLQLFSNPKILPSYIFVEEALAFQKDSPTAMLTNGKSHGKITMGASMGALMTNTSCSVKTISPLEWKGGFGLIFPDLSYRLKKVKAVEFATEMFPNQAHLWKRVKDTSLAEAMLIALYGAIQAETPLPKGAKPTHAFKNPLKPLLSCLTS